MGDAQVYIYVCLEGDHTVAVVKLESRRPDGLSYTAHVRVNSNKLGVANHPHFPSRREGMISTQEVIATDVSGGQGYE